MKWYLTINKQWENITACGELYTDIPKLALIPILIALVAAILLPSVVANTFAKSSSGDSGNSGGSDDKPKTSGHKKDDGVGNHLAAPGSPVVVAKNKHKQQKNDGGNGGLAAPGSPVVIANSGNGDDGSSNSDGYDNGNIKKFDTSKSSFRIGGSDGKVVEYRPGFNETFYNSTLPYCFAVQSGSCYDSSTGHVIP